MFTRQFINRHFIPGISTVGLAIFLGVGSSAWADPLPGEVLKFQQLPLGDLLYNPNPVAPGHDELSTATLSTAAGVFTGTFAADDFSDNVTAPIVHVQWWGSYLGASAPPNQVQQFLVSFESDVPAGPAGGISTPGTVLSSQIVTLGGLKPGSGTFTQTPDPSVSTSEPIYKYNAELSVPFDETADTVYWLKIVALTAPGDPTQWGWHNRDYTISDPLAAAVVPGEVNLGSAANPVWHFQDDAVSGSLTYDPQEKLLREGNFSPLFYNTTTDGFPAGAAAPSEDLAFNLYYASVPEPTSLSMLGLSMLLLVHRRRRVHS